MLRKMKMNRMNSRDSRAGSFSTSIEHHTITCPNIGPVEVHTQGIRSPREVVILTCHDLGCDHTMYQDFIDHPRMIPIRNRTVWIHVVVPGQGFEAPDLPADYQFPTMQAIAEDLTHILDQLNAKEVVCFGEGAGANILARFAMMHHTRVLGVCLIHATSTAAGLLTSLKDKFMSWKLEQVGMNSGFENYLILHRFGGTKFSKAADREELRNIVESYQETLRSKVNCKNLQKFVDSFLKRTAIVDNVKNLNCPVLLVTGQLSVFNETTRALNAVLVKAVEDKGKVEFLEVAEVANVLEEKPDKLAECFQYFLQGIGLVSSVPMHNVQKMLRNRTMSMEDYDKPTRERKSSLSCGSDSPTSPGTPTMSPSLCPLIQGEMLPQQAVVIQ